MVPFRGWVEGPGIYMSTSTVCKYCINVFVCLLRFLKRSKSSDETSSQPVLGEASSSLRKRNLVVPVKDS